MIQTEYFQFRYKNFRRPSGRIFYKIRGTEDQILEYVEKHNHNKTHLQWLLSPSDEAKATAELIDLTDQPVKPKQLELSIT